MSLATNNKEPEISTIVIEDDYVRFSYKEFDPQVPKMFTYKIRGFVKTKEFKLIKPKKWYEFWRWFE